MLDTRLLFTILKASIISVSFDAFEQCKDEVIRLKDRLKSVMMLEKSFAKQNCEKLYNFVINVDTSVKVENIRWNILSKALTRRIQDFIYLCVMIWKKKLDDMMRLVIVSIVDEESLEFQWVSLVYMLLMSWWKKSVKFEMIIM